MQGISIPALAVVALSAAFAITGFVQLLAPGFVRRAYDAWGLPKTLNRAIGALEIVAAILLATPSMRLGGVLLAAVLNFLAVVTLLGRREYGMALPGLVVMVALAPAALAAL